MTTSAYVAKGAGELTVPAGAQVFVHSIDDRDGLAIVIYDGKVGASFSLKMDIFIQSIYINLI